MNKSNNYLFHNKSLYWFYKLFFFAFTGFIGQANKIKQKIKTSGDQNAGRGDKMAVGLVTSLRLGDQFCGTWR